MKPSGLLDVSKRWELNHIPKWSSRVGNHCMLLSGLSRIKFWDALVPLCNLQSCLQLRKLNWLMLFGCLATNINFSSTIPLLCFTDVPYEISDIDLRLLCAYLSLCSMVRYAPLAFTAQLRLYGTVQTISLSS